MKKAKGNFDLLLKMKEKSEKVEVKEENKEETVEEEPEGTKEEPIDVKGELEALDRDSLVELADKLDVKTYRVRTDFIIDTLIEEYEEEVKAFLV